MTNQIKNEIELSDCCNAPLEKISQGENSDLNWCSKCGDRCNIITYTQK